MNKNHRAGFTLIELLVAISLFTIVAGAVLSLLLSTSRASAQLSATAALQQDMISSQQILANRLKAAWYIVPNASVVNMPNTALTKNLVTNGSSWTVGTHPFMAAILFPATPGDTCNTSASPAATEGCYRFVAYYPVLRSVWVQNTSGSRNPGENLDNDAQTWVLAEYLSYFATPPTTASALSPVSTTVQGQTNLLADYVMPTTSTPTYRMFTPQTVTRTSLPSNFSPSWPNTYVNGMMLEIRANQKVRGQDMYYPSASTTLRTSVYPEGVGISGQ